MIFYVIQHENTKELYFGITGNLKARLSSHNNKIIHDEFNRSTFRRCDGLWVLVYAEYYRSKSDAFKRENVVKKHGNSKRFIIKRIKNSLIKEMI